MAESNREPPLCPCGFWGSTQTSGLCSKCYKETLKRKECSSSSSLSPSSVQPANPVKVVVTPASPSRPPANNLFSLASHSPTKWPKGKSRDDPCDENEDNITAETPRGLRTEKDIETSRDSCKTFKTSQENDISSEQLQGKFCEISEACSLPLTKTTDLNSLKDVSTGLDNDHKSSETTPERVVQKNKRKCFKCRCKLDLASCEIGHCKCDYVFCELHRLPEQHDCCYDHKEMGRQEARQKMVSPKKQVGTSLKRLDSDL